jgi:hypothetical protein
VAQKLNHLISAVPVRQNMEGSPSAILRIRPTAPASPPEHTWPPSPCHLRACLQKFQVKMPLRGFWTDRGAVGGRGGGVGSCFPGLPPPGPVPPPKGDGELKVNPAVLPVYAQLRQIRRKKQGTACSQRALDGAASKPCIHQVRLRRGSEVAPLDISPSFCFFLDPPPPPPLPSTQASPWVRAKRKCGVPGFRSECSTCTGLWWPQRRWWWLAGLLPRPSDRKPTPTKGTCQSTHQPPFLPCAECARQRRQAR